MEQLTEKKTMLEQLNSQIAAAMQSSEELQSDILESEEIQDTIMEYVSIAKQRVESNCPRPHPLDATALVFTPTLAPREPVNCLPKLTLPTLSGDTLMWQSFKDFFDAAVHNCPSIFKYKSLTIYEPSCAEMLQE